MSDTEQLIYSTYDQYVHIRDAYVSGDVETAIELLRTFIDLHGEESIPLIVKTPVRTYKNTLIHASSIADIGKYIHSYTIYFKDSLWLVIHFKSLCGAGGADGAGKDFSMIYTSKIMYTTGPFKTREYIDYNTPYVVNRPNQPLHITICHWCVRVTYEERYGGVLYHSAFKFFAKYESVVTELQLMTIIN